MPSGEQELRQLAVALAPAGDHQPFAAKMLSLDREVATASRQVRCVEALGQKSLQPLLSSGSYERLPFAIDELPRRTPSRPVEREHLVATVLGAGGILVDGAWWPCGG